MKWKKLYGIWFFKWLWFNWCEGYTSYSWLSDEKTYKMILGFTKAVIVAILSLQKPLTSKRVQCISLNNDLSLAWPTLINSNPGNLSYFPFINNSDRCGGSCNTLDDLYDVNLKVLSMITWTNESKSLVKHISCDCKCRFNG